jgi:Nucleolar protein 12 (25kDa)
MAPGRRPSNRATGALVYNPEAHREFVTGFRRRKQERRSQAAKEIAETEKQTRRDERKERRAILKRTADRARGVNFDHSSDDEECDTKDMKQTRAGASSSPAAKAKTRPHANSGGGEGHGLCERAGAGILQGRVSKVYSSADAAAQVTTTITPMQTFADAHFSARLPKSRPSNPSPTRGYSNGTDMSPTYCGSFAVADGCCRTKMSHSKAKKIGKMHRHSKIAKVQRDRKLAKAGRSAKKLADD